MSNSVEIGIQEISETLGIPKEELMKDFEKLRKSDNVVNNEYLASDEAKDVFCIMALKVSVANRAEAKEFKCVPVGFGGLRKSKSKKTGVERIWIEIFALFPTEDDAPCVRRISVYYNPEIYKDLSFDPPHMYTVTLSKFQDGSYSANDERSVWTDSKPIDSPDILDFITKIRVVDIPSNVARTVKEYSDSTDWRCIVGIVAATNMGERKDKFGQWAYLDLGDGSLLEPVEADSQRTLYPAIRIWCPIELLPQVSEQVAVYGTIAMGDDGFTMQTYMVKRLVKLPEIPGME